MMRVTEKSFDSQRPGLAIVLLAADTTARFDGGIGGLPEHLRGRWVLVEDDKDATPLYPPGFSLEGLEV